MKKMEKIIFLALIILTFTSVVVKAQTALPPNLFSQNGWMADTVGKQTSAVDSANCPGLKNGYNLPCYVNGKLHMRWASVEDSEAKYVRFGGITVDQNNPPRDQYLKFVDSIRARGMEPILQIPVNAEDGSSDYDTLNAKILINYINNTYARNVVYWSIGNEPDHAVPGGYGYDTKEEAILITNYIKNFSKAMRRAVPSVPIKIIGPELADWNSDAGYTKKKLVDSLLTPNQRCDITGKDPVTNKWWIDIFSFHFYGGINGDGTSLPRATLIAKLRSTNDLAQTLDTLNVKLTAANSYHSRGTNALKSAITEAHIAYQTDTADAFSNVKCNGFFAGQYWMEIASIAAEKGIEFVNFWSAAEGSMGYMDNWNKKKSTYCHFKKIAENFSGAIYIGSDSISGGPIANIKAFGTKDGSHIAVVIMNQDSLVTGYPPKRHYGINLNGIYTGITAANKIKISMGVNKVYQDSIESASTTLLEFDLLGNLSQKYEYKQSGNNSPECFQQSSSCSTSATYANQGQFDLYAPSVYSNITIGNGSNWITLLNTNNSIYRTSNNTTVKGHFKVPLGLSFSIIPTPCN